MYKLSDIVYAVARRMPTQEDAKKYRKIVEQSGARELKIDGAMRDWRRLMDLSEDELWAVVVKVRNQNFKFNHEFTKVDGKNQYNLNFQ